MLLFTASLFGCFAKFWFLSQPMFCLCHFNAYIPFWLHQTAYTYFYIYAYIYIYQHLTMFLFIFSCFFKIWFVANVYIVAFKFTWTTTHLWYNGNFLQNLTQMVCKFFVLFLINVLFFNLVCQFFFCANNGGCSCDNGHVANSLPQTIRLSLSLF